VLKSPTLTTLLLGGPSPVSKWAPEPRKAASSARRSACALKEVVPASITSRSCGRTSPHPAEPFKTRVPAVRSTALNDVRSRFQAMLPDLDRADRIGEFWGHPATPKTAVSHG
jgi:hypothetical protein